MPARQEGQDALVKSPAELTAEYRALRQDVRWEQAVAEPEFAKFKEWTTRYAKAAPAQRAALEVEGARLAEQRREPLARMIEENPSRALELAVPNMVWQQMPARVAAQLEKPVSARGDLMVIATVPLPGSSAPPKSRIARIAGEEFPAFVEPGRSRQPTRVKIPIHGIVLDGRMAVSDAAARPMEAGEIAAAKAAAGGNQVCEVSGLDTTVNADESALDVAGDPPRFFCSARHAMKELGEMTAEERAQGPGSGSVQASGWTEGAKKLLIMRVDFSDYTGNVTDASGAVTKLTNMVAADKIFWEAMSYGKASWQPVGQGSVITSVLRLPKTSSNYSSLGTMLDAARAAARGAGFNPDSFDFDMVVTDDKPSVGFAGVAYVGWKGCWLANDAYWGQGVSSHELGHNFGLWHASSWDTPDDTIIGTGSRVEYGDNFDTMGAAANNPASHFNSHYKNYLDWLPDADVTTVSASGTFRLYSHDVQSGKNRRALRIARTASQAYWVEMRQLWTQNRWSQGGVHILWANQNGNDNSELLDTTQATSTVDDAPLVIGRTFSDIPTGVHITPIAKFPGTPQDSIDVVVNIGTFPTNRKPTLSITATATAVAPNATVTFTAAASDADNDTLAYFWDFGDNTFGNNSATATKSWSATAQRLVRCTVTDMRGGIASAAVVVRVGNPSTYSISGRVLNDVGGVEGVTVSTGAFSSVSNTDGSYTLVGLPSGSYSLTAKAGTRTFLPVGFANPVVVPTDKVGINFGTAPATPRISPLPPLIVNLNTPIGPIPFTVADQDTDLSLLSFSAVSDNLSLVAAKDVVVTGTGANRMVTVTPGTNQTGTARLQIVCRDPDNNSTATDWTITVNSPPSLDAPTARTPEEIPIDIQLWSIATDLQTGDNQLLFALSNPLHGTVELLPDGHTARFTPEKDYNGTASFELSATDQSLESRLLLYYSFEGPDDLTDAKADDRSNFGRSGRVSAIGGGEFSYSSDDVADTLALYDSTALQLVETRDGTAARLTRDIPATELNFSASPWTFACWFKRDALDDEDMVFHLGDGSGEGVAGELFVTCPAGTPAVQFAFAGNRSAAVPGVEAGVWHHVAVTFVPGAGGAGVASFYLDGAKAFEAAGTALNFSQAVPMVVGGHSVATTRTDRWLNGKLDEVALWSTAFSPGEVARLSQMVVSHFSGTTRSAVVNISVSPVDDSPTVSEIVPQTVNEDDGPFSVAFSVSDDTTPASSLAVQVSSSNPGLFPSSRLLLGGTGTSRTLQLQPLPERSGSAEVSLVVSDGALSTTRTFSVTVAPVNDAPTVSGLSNVTLPEDGSAVMLPFEIADRDTPASTLMVTAETQNAELIPNANIVLSGVGTSRAISIRPVVNGSGSATIKVAVSDGGEVPATASFSVTVSSSNDAPTISAIANQAGPAGNAFAPIAFTVADADTPVSSLLISATSSNKKLFPPSGVVLGGSGSDRTVTLTPATAQTGSGSITLFVSDGKLKTARTFSVVVGAGNLSVFTSGAGTVSAGFLGRSSRTAGDSITISAKPNAGFVFSGWSGGLESSDASFTFVMPETLELTATFSPSPVGDLKGAWNGLVTSDPATHATTGAIAFVSSPTGTFSGKLVVGGLSHSFKGLLNSDGESGTLAIPHTAFSLQFQIAGAPGEEKASGTITGAAAPLMFDADRAVFTAKPNPAVPLRNVPAAWLGKYTLLLPPADSTSTAGSGMATLFVTPTGIVKISGKLADGTAFSSSHSLSAEGVAPFYVALSRGTGSASGPLAWELKEESDLGGTVHWFRPTDVDSAGTMLQSTGSRYVAPQAAKGGLPAILPLPLLGPEITTGNLSVTLAMPGVVPTPRAMNLSATGKLTAVDQFSADKLKLKITPSTGAITGSFTDPATRVKYNVSGVLSQKVNGGGGFHVGGSTGGKLSIELKE